MLMSAMEGDVRLAPESYDRLPSPLTHVAVAQEAPRDWLLPILSDFMCEERTFKTIEPAKEVLAVSVVSKVVRIIFSPFCYIIQEHRKIPERLILDDRTRQAFSSGPLTEIDIDKYVVYLSREELKREPVSSALPFDVSLHSQARSAVALSMIARLENDMKIYADQQNDDKTPKCYYLLDEDVTDYVTKSSPDASKKIEAVSYLLSCYL